MGEIIRLGREPARARAAPKTRPAELAARIREMILEDELPPGTPIRERQLADRLGVSRTPLREALKILAAEGLVELEPRRGASVADPSPQEIRDLLELLGAIEAFAARLACVRAEPKDLRELRALQHEMVAAWLRGDHLGYFHRNQAIHRRIVELAGNRALSDCHRTLNARVYRARYICNLRTRRWEQAIREHEHILQALERRDGAAAARLLETHVLAAWERMRAMEAEAAHDASAATAAPEANSASISASE
jgi:DNA-binding GntR family transcriptional regulator